MATDDDQTRFGDFVFRYRRNLLDRVDFSALIATQARAAVLAVFAGIVGIYIGAVRATQSFFDFLTLGAFQIAEALVPEPQITAALGVTKPAIPEFGILAAPVTAAVVLASLYAAVWFTGFIVGLDD